MRWLSSFFTLLLASSLVACGDPALDTGPELTRRDAEPAGPHCADGGTAVHSGHDVDRDGALGDDEIEATVYECDAAPPRLIREDELAPDLGCPTGGTAVHTGSDDDRDGVLDDAEIDGTVVTCHDVEIWHGDFTAADWHDAVKVAALEQARVVTGSLDRVDGEFRLPLLELVGGDLHPTLVDTMELPKLREVSGKLNVGGGMTSMRLDALEQIGGDLSLLGTKLDLLALPALRRVGGKLDLFSETTLLRIDLPALEQLGGVRLEEVAQLTNLAAPALTRISGKIFVQTAPVLAALDFDRLTEAASGFLIVGAPRLTRLLVPQLARVGMDEAVPGGFVLVGTGLDHVRLPALREVAQNLLFDNNPALIDVELPALVHTGALVAERSAKLESIVAPELAECGDLTLSELPRLGELRLDQVAHLDFLLLQRLPYAQLPALPSLTTLKLLKLDDMDELLDLRGWPALVQVDSLAVRNSARIVSLAGLEQLTTMSGELRIDNDPALTSLHGLDGLTSLGGALVIRLCDALPAEEIAAFSQRLGKPLTTF